MSIRKTRVTNFHDHVVHGAAGQVGQGAPSSRGPDAACPQTVNQNFNRLLESHQRIWQADRRVFAAQHLVQHQASRLSATRSEAIRCFYDNGLDVLVMDNFVLEKRRERLALRRRGGVSCPPFGIRLFAGHPLLAWPAIEFADHARTPVQPHCLRRSRFLLPFFSFMTDARI
jgi:hypothetical protein